MKKYFILIICFVVINASLVKAEEQNKKTAFAVVSYGYLPSLFTNSLSRELPSNLFTQIRFVAKNDDMTSILVKKFIDSLAEIKQSQEIGVIGLVFVPGELSFREYIDISKHVAILNIAPLAPPDDTSKEAKELFKARVLKQVTRLASLLTGVEECPFFLCGMFDCKTLKELDTKSRNLCPPCQLKIEQVMIRSNLYLAPPGETPPDREGQ